MSLRRLRPLALTLGMLMHPLLLPPSVSAGGPWLSLPAREHYAASAGYTVPIQHVYQFPAAIVWQPTAPTGYTVPIQHVYQFPAAIVWQPDAVLPPALPVLHDVSTWTDHHHHPH